MDRIRKAGLGRKIGNAIGEARGQLGWSQQKLAEALDISVVHAGLLERGQRLPSLPMVINIAELLGISLDEIFLKRRQVEAPHSDEVSRLINALEPELRAMAIAFLRAGASAPKRKRPSTKRS